MERCLKNKSGIALVLSILIIGLIVAVTLQFNTSMWSELHAATNLGDGVKLGSIARSGFNYALAVLFEDGTSEEKFDAQHEAWADSAALSVNSASQFEEGRFEVKIIDHSGRIQVNQLVNLKGEFNTKQKELLTRFLKWEEFGLEEEEVRIVIESIKDWIDPDNDVMDLGAESPYYQTLEGPYSCRNAPMESLEELLLIRGITKELFYGTKEKPGISDYMTIHGSEGGGKININTADPLVLRSLSDQIDDDRIKNMVEYRMDEGNDLKDAKWYQKVSGMSDVSIDPDLITTSSIYFEIRSKGFKGAMTREVKGVVERKEGALKILSWRVE
jgi:general secretion pathway protein K